ncbi:hypothetical protein LCGC14_0423420 [marine sediment metagenome]|uniref:Uncharacterized protein n=1 Tax=marine sediment metagenome TaxID=412755 RepID=A0A0F9SW98_9ZZZZ
MPKYQMKCTNGHREEVRMSYAEYDRFKQGEVNFFCTKSSDCLARMDVELTTIPHVFAVNDKDVQFSKKKFGMGNLTEI